MPDGRHLQQHLQWGAEALWQQLEPLLPGLSVEVVASADSTNTRLIERARQAYGARESAVPGHGRRAGDNDPCLLVAEHQTHGRGRLGREWKSAAAQSLTFSLSLPLAPPDWSGLSLAVGLALADALDPPAAAPRIGLKWPNDLWLLDGPGSGRKLGGVLIETVASGDSRICIVGVGINVQPPPAGSPTAPYSTGFASLSEIDPAADAPAALARVVEPLVRALLRFAEHGFAPFAAGYAYRDLLFGQAVTSTAPQALAGIAEGVDERGALRIRADGLHTLVSGEVSVRLAAASQDDAC